MIVVHNLGTLTAIRTIVVVVAVRIRTVALLVVVVATTAVDSVREHHTRTSTSQKRPNALRHAARRRWLGIVDDHRLTVGTLLILGLLYRLWWVLTNHMQGTFAFFVVTVIGVFDQRVTLFQFGNDPGKFQIIGFLLCLGVLLGDQFQLGLLGQLFLTDFFITFTATGKNDRSNHQCDKSLVHLLVTVCVHDELFAVVKQFLNSISNHLGFSDMH
ncbi:hypothetical protein D3C72_1360500 [compost metagenome]